MSKRKVMFCWNCCEDTIHEFINKETIADGAGRVLLAILSLGLSESSVSATKYWQCTKCGNIDDE